MICPTCSKDIPPAFTICPFCAQTALNGDPLSNSGSKTSGSQFAAPSLLISLATLAGAALVLGMAYLKAKVWSHGNFTPEARGYFIGALTTPILLSWLIVWLISRKRNPPMASSRKGALGVLIALALSALSLVGEVRHLQPQSDEEIRQHISALAKQATGQAADDGTPGEFDDILRPLFADVKQFNADYMMEVSKLDNSALTTMYGLKSFDSDKSISRILEQLHATQAVDQKYASMDPLLQKTKERLFASSRSRQEKEGFWNGFEESFKKSLEPRYAANSKEQAWLNDSVAFYEFMRANEKSYRVKNNQVLFVSTALLNEYNERLDKVEDERKEFLAAKKNFEKAQKEGLNKIGLKPSDFGTPAQK